MRLGATLGVLVLVWGTTWAAIRIGLEGLPPLTGASLRFLIAGLLLLALMPAFGVRPGRSAAPRRERALWVVNGIGTFVVTYAVTYWAEQHVPSGLAAVLFATFPLWVAPFAHRWLPGERMTVRQAAGLLVGFAGVAVIFSEDLSRIALTATGELAAFVLLAAPFSAALANVAVKRWGRGIHPLSLTAPPMLLGSAVLGVLALLFERGRELTFDLTSVGALLYLAICGSALTFTLYFHLLERLPASRLALITYANPVVAVAVGALFLDEELTWRVAAGAALVLGGVALAVGQARRRRSPAASRGG